MLCIAHYRLTRRTLSVPTINFGGSSTSKTSNSIRMRHMNRIQSKRPFNTSDQPLRWAQKKHAVPIRLVATNSFAQQVVEGRLVLDRQGALHHRVGAVGKMPSARHAKALEPNEPEVFEIGSLFETLSQPFPVDDLTGAAERLHLAVWPTQGFGQEGIDLRTLSVLTQILAKAHLRS